MIQAKSMKWGGTLFQAAALGIMLALGNWWLTPLYVGLIYVCWKSGSKMEFHAENLKDLKKVQNTLTAAHAALNRGEQLYAEELSAIAAEETTKIDAREEPTWI